jgi:hypothetical protein
MNNYKFFLFFQLKLLTRLIQKKNKAKINFKIKIHNLRKKIKECLINNSSISSINFKIKIKNKIIKFKKIILKIPIFMIQLTVKI